MIRRRGNNWFFVWREGGRRRERTLATSDEEEAKHLAETLMAAVKARRRMAAMDALFHGDFSAVPVPTEADNCGGLLIADALDVGRRHRNLTAEHEQAWRVFADALPVRYMADITPQMALRYMDGTYGGKSPKRYNNVLTLLNVVCRSCLVESGLQASPFASLMPRRLDETEHYRHFTREEVARIFAALETHPYWRLLSLIAYHTGLRLESCKRLCPSMIADGLITIMPSKTARFGRAVQIPLTDVLAAELGKIAIQARETPYCDAYPLEPYLTWQGVTRAFYSRFLPMLGILPTADGDVGFHSWRVTYVTRLSEAGVPDRVIRGIVGHNSERMTDLYNHDSESARREKLAIENALTTTG